MKRIVSIRTSMYIFMATAVIVTASVPTRALAAVCGTPTAPSSTVSSVTAKAYGDWKAAYVVSAGNDTLRVQRSAGDNYDTVSEGIAYGMLFSVYSNDKTTFDGLWRYAKNHLNNHGVMNWRIAADGSTIGYNGATDADEDMAAALIAADTEWGGYASDATALIAIIKKYEVEPGSNVLKPGDVWGGSDLLNPSYLTPSYYATFARYTGDTSWNDVTAASYTVLGAIRNNTASKQTGYIPDWSRADGQRANGMGYDYGYDGSRAPLRLAMAAGWNCDANASGYLQALNTTNRTLDVSKLASSYALDGSVTGAGDGTPLLAAASVAATVSDDAGYRTKTWESLSNAPSKGYFSDSMRVFGLFVAGGLITDPLSLKKTVPQPAPVTTVSPKTYSLSGSSTTATVGTPVMLSATALSPVATKDSLVDLEVYDANGTRVAQKFSENVSLGASPVTLTVTFTPQAKGTYTLRGGIFSAGWASNMVWNSAIASVEISAAASQPVTPVPAPVITPPVVTPTPAPAPAPVVPPAPTTPVTAPLPVIAGVSVWWPGSVQAVSGVQPFKAVLDGVSLSDYAMYWQVDGGTLNLMTDNTEGAAYKLSLVDLKYWTWRGDNKYTVTFVAKNAAGSVISQKSVVITVVR